LFENGVLKTTDKTSLHYSNIIKRSAKTNKGTMLDILIEIENDGFSDPVTLDGIVEYLKETKLNKSITKDPTLVKYIDEKIIQVDAVFKRSLIYW
jgi:hypothetical protein